MNTLTSRATRKYYRQAKHEMPLCYSSKKEYLSDLQEIVAVFIFNNPLSAIFHKLTIVALYTTNTIA